MKNNAEEKRGRIWTCVVYPESAPENWKDLLDQQGISWVESPIHDKDVNADGEKKKAHWHVLLLFGTQKSHRQGLEITTLMNAPNPQK